MIEITERHPILGFHLTPRDWVREKLYERRSNQQVPPGRRAFVFGHLPGGERFPEGNVEQVREGIWKQLDRLDREEKITELITCSGAAGADSLAFEWVFQKMQDDPSRQITMMMYLPFNKRSFIDHSVWVSKDYDLNKRWLRNFKRAAQKGVVYRPHLLHQQADTLVANNIDIQLPSRKHNTRFRFDIRPFRLKNFAPDYDTVRAESARLNKNPDGSGDKYQHYIDVNTHMLSLLRQPDLTRDFLGDAVVALWDGNAAQAKDPTTGLPKPGGTYDILYQARGMGIKNIYITQEGLGKVETNLLSEFQQK